MTNDFDWDADFRRNGMSAADQVIRVLSLEQIKIGHEAIEEMIERMLTSPSGWGIVTVLQNSIETGSFDTHDYQITWERHYRLDPGVPFGRLYEFPSPEAYEMWQERGCPPPV